MPTHSLDSYCRPPQALQQFAVVAMTIAFLSFCNSASAAVSISATPEGALLDQRLVIRISGLPAASSALDCIQRWCMTRSLLRSTHMTTTRRFQECWSSAAPTAAPVRRGWPCCWHLTDSPPCLYPTLASRDYRLRSKASPWSISRKRCSGCVLNRASILVPSPFTQSLAARKQHCSLQPTIGE